jgi:hypothetical protein
MRPVSGKRCVHPDFAFTKSQNGRPWAPSRQYLPVVMTKSSAPSPSRSTGVPAKYCESGVGEGFFSEVERGCSGQHQQQERFEHERSFALREVAQS